MDNQTQQPPIPQTPIGMQPVLPNATAALVLGIISIPTCFCAGIVGLVCGIIAIILGNKAVKLHKANPGVYTTSSYNNANAGKICGIIGTILSALYLIFYIVYFIIVGTILTSLPWSQLK
ncbi:MAG TPA: CCC motif membrane protein [Bacteroidia bacterium]